MLNLLINNHEALAVLAARVFLGILFFFQGYDAVFRVKVSNVMQAYEAQFTNRRMPRFLIVLGTYFTSYVELICGFLLIIGLFEFVSVCILAISLIVATIAFSAISPMWDMKFLFPRLLLILFLLLMPAYSDFFSFDNLLEILRNK
jgi:putative oxidoreductase